MIYLDPDTCVHPLRFELTDEEIIGIVERAHCNDDSLSLDELDCALDYLFDVVALERQTHPGSTVLQ
jgi:hypothetical protein